MFNANQIHSRAVEISTRYKKCEGELVDIFQELDRTKAFMRQGANSLFDYSVRILKLSESTTANLIAVARKSREVPQLKAAIMKGELSVSKAKKISSVITSANQDKWLELAMTSSSRVIEKEVARVNPQSLILETIKYKSAERLEISFGISEELDRKLKRVKDLIAQKKSVTVTSEEALEEMVDHYLERFDPVMKAERVSAKTVEKRIEQNSTGRVNDDRGQQVPGPAVNMSASNETDFGNSQRLATTQNVCRNKSQNISGKNLRKKISASIAHAVNLRDKRRCTHTRNGERCVNMRWLDVHHIIPVARGGSNGLENLTTLCSGHHRAAHDCVTVGLAFRSKPLSRAADWRSNNAD